ncbi:MAG: hypothetical protein EBX52_10420 [Proteobacteria bacterium]|nr:hypothetical protein [Pseudomonadota bacterium]
MGKKRNDSGQAILEYMIVLLIIVSISGVIQFGVSKSRNKLWKWMICQISAACPGCNPTASANKTLQSGGPCKK